MRISLIQVCQNELYNFGEPDNLNHEQKLLLRNEMIDKTITGIKSAAAKGANLIVTTEAINFARPDSNNVSAISDLIPELPYDIHTYDRYKESEYYFDEFENISREYECYIVAGIINKRDKLYNSAIVYKPGGNIEVIYDKVQLAGDEKKIYKSGKEIKYFDTAYGRIGVLICYDMQFPELSRALARKGVDLIVAPTWGWEWIYGPARAYENGVYVAAAMSVPYDSEINGVRSPSQIISYTGKVIQQGSYSDGGIVTADVDITDCRRCRQGRISEISCYF